jgi:hypothetical protein
MARTAILCGGLMVALGVGGFLGTHTKNLETLIPALFGVVILGLGVAALRQAWRPGAMHTAVVVGLVGFVLVVSSLFTLAKKILEEPSLVTNSLMAILSGTFVLLSLKSFVQARRRRPKPPEPREGDTAANGSGSPS